MPAAVQKRSFPAHFIVGSGKASRGGLKLNIIMCRAYDLVARKRESVPWRRSRTPSTPKQLLNL